RPRGRSGDSLAEPKKTMVSWIPSRRKQPSGSRYSARMRSGRASSLSRNSSLWYARGRRVGSGGFMTAPCTRFWSRRVGPPFASHFLRRRQPKQRRPLGQDGLRGRGKREARPPHIGVGAQDLERRVLVPQRIPARERRAHVEEVARHDVGLVGLRRASGLVAQVGEDL